MIKCKQIDMILNPNQIKILLLWFFIWILMYNETINYIKNRLSFNDIKTLKKLIINFQT